MIMELEAIERQERYQPRGPFDVQERYRVRTFVSAGSMVFDGDQVAFDQQSFWTVPEAQAVCDVLNDREWSRRR